MSDFLRRWHRDDADALAGIYVRADSDLLNNIPDDQSLAGAQAWLDEIWTAEEDGSAVAFAIVQEDSNSDTDRTAGRYMSEEAARVSTPVGNVMATAIDRRHSTAWISYWLDSNARGQGLAAAGLRSIVDHLHEALAVYRLELGYRVNNPASAAVAKSAGFIVEGRQRERLSYDGVRYDTEECARLVGDPRPQRRRLPILASETTSPDDGGGSESR
ncbi:GNAT family N-acetyltransferase [Brevibacterium sandarakinum]|uniref:GNAT family N-acetyltransferase n=1 Tax=Brevibacterium sandarakinum TaxID=629680 RepID=UPI00264B7269|nr:GNAT family protein [Brevibacterium sandarakinum]MDN5658513.1 GNAT family N-acetyltransferase [Brevibacterium sandarakinum]